ncbi:MAG: hypothetical protein U9R34_01200 [Nanoarchaeota archaeon]|nr:hypothetical protein [Nanoarchaeota archaeon]
MRKTLKSRIEESNLELRQKNLEQHLKQKAHISLKDRLNNVTYNIRHNAESITTVGLAAGVGGLLVWNIFAYANYTKLTSDFKEAHAIIGDLYGYLEFGVDQGMQVKIPPKVFELPRALIEQGSQEIYAEESKGILEGIDQILKSCSQNPISKQLVESLGTVKYNLSMIAESSKETLLGVSAAVGSILYGIGLGIFGSRVRENSGWKDQLDDKKNLQKQLRHSLPELKAKFANHSYAEQAYNYLDEIAKSGISGPDLLENANIISGYSGDKYKSVFEEINLNPRQYQKREELQLAFQEYD